MAWIRRGAWALAIVLGGWGLAWLALPPVLRWQGESRLAEALGRPVRIDRVDVRPWQLARPCCASTGCTWTSPPARCGSGRRCWKR
ncbi:hypothetical protein ABXN37_15110 [Piscinibacter sakaiensis]|uniref:hypothetical protein n=1 Tax=Piscinibacter sakaiensis TaxID=1547922 RepID=UPI00372745D2